MKFFKAQKIILFFFCVEFNLLQKLKPTRHTTRQRFIYSKKRVMWLGAAHAVCVYIIAGWWHHAPTKVTTEVFKFFGVSFISSLPLLIFPDWSSVLFRCSSPVFFISCQMNSKTGLIPRPTASPVDLSASPCSWSSSMQPRSHLAALFSLSQSFCFHLTKPILYSLHLSSFSYLTFHTWKKNQI